MKKFVLISISIILMMISAPVSASESAEMSSVQTINFGKAVEFQLDEEKQCVVIYVSDVDYTTERMVDNASLYLRTTKKMAIRLNKIKTKFSDNRIIMSKFYMSREYITYRDNYLMEIYVPYEMLGMQDMTYLEKSNLIHTVISPKCLGKTLYYTLDENNVTINMSTKPVV